ncbi:GNAT family N-acetyltransferase [Marinactinospora thermotolerans]|uniref:GNAT family N-acetyltransferase n=1 Tax=Marinactinospora thermotolerans TaxID=531310 RepID=UPI003D8FBC6E
METRPGPRRRVTIVRAEPFTTRRLRMEPLRIENAEEMAGALADPALYEHIGGRPPSPVELRQRYERLVAGSAEPGISWCNWVVRDGTGTAVGTVQATIGPVPGGLGAVIAWMVGVPWQGRGFASEAARGLIAWLHARGVRPVTAHIHPDNLASEAVARNCGLRRTDRHADGELVWTEAT